MTTNQTGRNAAEPLYFGPSSRPLAGWLHPSRDQARDGAPAGAVVICNPFGYEAVCAHRSIRHLAESIAAAGVPALRFDYDGTGDSAGEGDDPDRLKAWVASVVAAIAAVRERTGASRVWLVGIRLGVLVASLAARDLREAGDPSVSVAGLVAIAPVVSGRAYVRELRALHGALGLAGDPNVVPPASEGGPALTDDEAIGFALTEETRKALGEVDLTKLGSPAPEILILDRSDLPSANKWIPRLQERGAAVDARQVEGYVEMVLDPHHAVVPEAMFEATTSWVAARVKALPTSAGGAKVAANDTMVSTARIGDVVERQLFLDDGRNVFGVAALAADSVASGPSTGRAILLLNSGAIHHVGPNRLYVPFARAWAAAGDLVVRLDITGIGESPTRPNQTENVVYSDSALDDVALAIGWARRQPGVKEVWLIGLCSGAYHAFKSAVAGERIAGYVAINPLTFFWSPETPLDFAAHNVITETERYKSSVLSLEKWKKLLDPAVALRVAKTVGVRARSVAMAHAKDVSRRVGMPWKEDLAAEIDAVARRRVRQHYVFAKGDPGEPMLRGEGGRVVRALLDDAIMTIGVVEGPDHTFTPRWSHAPLERLLRRAFSGRSFSGR